MNSVLRGLLGRKSPSLIEHLGLTIAENRSKGDRWMDGWMDGRMDGGTEGRRDGGTVEGRRDGRMDGWIDRLSFRAGSRPASLCWPSLSTICLNRVDSTIHLINLYNG